MHAMHCIALSNVMCNPTDVVERGRRTVADFSLVLTSARMLSSLEDCATLGVDCTFNLVSAKVVFGVICALSRGMMAKPVAICVLDKEATDCLEHALRQLTEAAKAVGLSI